MGMTLANIATVRRIEFEVKLIERRGIRALAPIVKRLRKQLIVGDNLEKVEQELQEQLAEIAVFTHLTGMKRSFLLLPKSARSGLALGLFQKSLKALAVQLGADVGVLEAQYLQNVLKSVKDLTEPAEQELEQTLIQAQGEGLHVSQVTKALQARFDELNVTANAETLARTQTQLAYNAGRWQADQDPVIQEILWGYEYIAIKDDRVRPTHEAMHGTRLPKEDPFWQTNWPPNGWNCRCAPIPIFDEGIEKQPKKLPDGNAANPDEGFVFNPGQQVGKLSLDNQTAS